MNRCSGLISMLIAAGLVAACATTPDPGPGTRSGMDRVSPVRAAEVNTQLGIGYLERGQLQIAMEKLQTALEHDSAHVPAHVTLALIYEQVGDERRATQHYRQAMRLAPNDGATLNSYAAHICRQGDFDQAAELFERASRDPFYDTPEVALTNAGACARRAGRLDQAEASLRRALDLDPEFPDALYFMAQTFYEKGEPFRARAFLQRLESTGQVDADALLLGYRIESRLGNSPHASKYSAWLEERYPDSRQARELRQQRHTNDR